MLVSILSCQALKGASFVDVKHYEGGIVRHSAEGPAPSNSRATGDLPRSLAKLQSRNSDAALADVAAPNATLIFLHLAGLSRSLLDKQ
jgi:hypothetical protein